MGTGGECREGVGDEVDACRGGLIIAAWAVGGEVSFINAQGMPMQKRSMMVHNYVVLGLLPLQYGAL